MDNYTVKRLFADIFYFTKYFLFTFCIMCPWKDAQEDPAPALLQYINDG